MTLTPVGPMVLVELLDDNRPGPVIRMAAVDTRRLRCARVVTAGPGVLSEVTGERCPPDVRSGDRVLLDPNTVTHESPLLSPGMVLVNEADIACVLDDATQVVI